MYIIEYNCDISLFLSSGGFTGTKGIIGVGNGEGTIGVGEGTIGVGEGTIGVRSLFRH